MDKLAAMAVFVEIVDQGSLSAAATNLGKSLPTVVRTLATLEDHLGVRLLRRTTRRMSLTEEGRTYLEHCQQVLADVREAEEILESGRAEPRGELRITAPVLFGQMRVAPAVTSFLRHYQHVRVELLLLDRVVNLVEEGIDVGIRISHLDDASMIAIPVDSVRKVVVASPELIQRVGAPTHARELCERPCVQFQGTAAGAHWDLYQHGTPISISVEGPLRCNQAAAGIDACVSGLGFGLFLSYQVEPMIAANKLVILDTFSSPPIPVSIVYPHARLMSSRSRTFVDWMKDALRAPPAAIGTQGR